MRVLADVKPEPAMNTLLPCTLAVAMLGAALPVSAPVHASSNLQRCVAPDGADVYTDKACALVGASASPLPAELLARIARDEAMEQRLDPLTGSVDASQPLDGTMPVGRRSPESGCAKTTSQLASDLRGAFTLGDVNRVAESYHWAGMSSKAGRRVMDRLQSLSTKRVLDARSFGGGFATLADGATLLASADGNRVAGTNGMLQLVLGDDQAPTVVDFDVHRYAGCYFVSF